MPIFCPYTGKEIPEASASKEHIIPYALGGPNTLTIQVERAANNTLGAEVDAPVSNQMFGLARASLGLKGNSGATSNHRIPISIEGPEPRTGFWQPYDRQNPFSLTPVINEEQLPDGQTRITVSGDPERARQIMAGMQAKFAAQGRPLVDVHEAPLPILSPKIRGHVPIDVLALNRFFPKLLLGFGHWKWKRAWSESPIGARLRNMLWCKSTDEHDELAINHMHYATSEDLSLRLSPHEHLFVGMGLGAQGYSLSVFLFGGGGMVLYIPPSDATIQWPTDGIFALVDTQTRTLRELTSIDVINEGYWSRKVTQTNSK